MKFTERNRDKLLIERGTLNVIRTMKEGAGNEESEVWVSEVWRLDAVNLNGRVYPRSLAERIVSENKKLMAYDGHEADWQSGHDFAPAVAYCDNPRVENNCLVVDIHFLKAQKDSDSVRNIRELHAAGIPIGVSSVGYGSVDENGVVQEDFELVRYMDFVSMPAALVYADPKEKETKEKPDDSDKGEPMGKPETAELSAAKEKALGFMKKRIL